MGMGIDLYKAKNMNKLSLNHRVETMSEKMKDLLDDIYALSREGRFSAIVSDITFDEIELLQALGYRVVEKMVSGKVVDIISEEPVYGMRKYHVISWN